MQNRTGRIGLALLVAAILHGLCWPANAQQPEPGPDSEESIPHWIWHEAERAEGQSVSLVRSFDVGKNIASARLHLAAVFTNCVLSVNGKSVLRLDEYGPWSQLDLTEWIRVGKNALELRCTSGEGPAAVAA